MSGAEQLCHSTSTPQTRIHCTKICHESIKMHSALKTLQDELSSGVFDRSDEELIEDLLQRILSVLAELPDWASRDQEKDDEEANVNEDLVHIAASCLLESSHVNNDSSTPLSTANQAWQSAWKMIASEIFQNSLSPSRIHITATMTSLHLSNTAAFVSTCIILSCYSLNSFASTVGPLVRRKKRWRSIMFETLRGFQRSTPFLSGISSRRLFCTCVLPAVEAARCKLHQDVNDDLGIFDVQLHAVVIQCLAVLAMSEPTRDPSDLYASVTRLRMEDPIQYLSEHCWRQHHREQILGGKSDNNDSLLLTRLTTFSNDEKVDSDDEDDDYLIGLETKWPDKGIAILLTSEACFQSRPCTWSKIYQWHVFFPYISTIMKEELEIQSNRADSGGNQMCGLLEQLLRQLSRHALTSPRNDESPDHPFPVFQWLVNAMVQSSRDVGVKTPSIYFQLMNTLVSRFQPESQMYLVAHRIYPSCPYLAMKPKIIDLLRNHRYWSDTEVTLRQQVWNFVESSLLNEQNWEQEELLVALLGLFDVAPPVDIVNVLNRIEGVFREKDLILPVLIFTMDRIRERFSN